MKRTKPRIKWTSKSWSAPIKTLGPLSGRVSPQICRLKSGKKNQRLQSLLISRPSKRLNPLQASCSKSRQQAISSIPIKSTKILLSYNSDHMTTLTFQDYRRARDLLVQNWSQFKRIVASVQVKGLLILRDSLPRIKRPVRGKGIKCSSSVYQETI